MDAERSSLVGRAHDSDAILALLGRTERLVTLTGVGGVGKTRLARHVASCRREARPGDAIHWVDLRGASGADEAAARVANAIGAPLVATAAMSSIDQVGLALGDGRSALLVLDDFDHLVPIAETAVGRWLALAPGLRCLVTSRQALGIQGELRHEVAPLAADDALELFLGRVQAVSPGFVASHRVREIARELVGRLDCLPLAIELAAARSVVLAPAEILGRLDRRLDLLKVDAGHRIGARHSSLRGALEWSWSLLPESGRQALAALAVFEGGFSVAAAAAVIGTGDPAVDQLASLRERSLVAADGDSLEDESRFALLESVRELAAEKLDERGEREAAETRHAAFFLAAGEAWAEAAHGREGELALRHLRRESGNLVRAGQLSLRRDPDASVRIALALGEALALSGPPAIQLALLDDAVAAAAALGPELRAHALLLRGDARAICGRRVEGAADLHEAARQGRTAGDARLEGRALRQLGVLRRDDGDFETARLHLERAAELFEIGSDRRLLSHTIGNLATLYRQEGWVEAARTHYLRALEIDRDNGDRWAEGAVLAGLGHLEAAAGRAEEATRHYREALELLGAVDDRRTVGVVGDRLALLALERGDPSAALPLLDAARADLRAVGDRGLEGVVSAHRAVALALAGRDQEAVASLDSAARALDRIDDARIAAALRLARSWVELAGKGPGARREAADRALEAARADQRRLAVAPGEDPFVEYVSDLRRALAGALARELDGPPREAGHGIGCLEVNGRGEWVSLEGGTPIHLTPVIARLLDRLVDERLARPGQPLGLEELARCLWPDERLAPRVTGARIYSAVAKLRRLGLATVLVRQSGGYFLHPAVRCARQDR